MDVECALEFLSLSSSQGKKEHFCHRHPLQLLEETSSLELLLCQICNKLSSSGPFWGCEPCDFHVHKHCLIVLPQKVQTKLHSQLVSLVLKASPSRKCIHCETVSDLAYIVHRSSNAYMCISCCLVGRMVDESASQLPKDIDHFLHPCPVRLVFSPFSACNACFRSGGENRDFFYHCQDCDFFLHPECAQPPPTHSEADQIRHFCHLHPLELFRDVDDSSFLCRLCESSCSKSFYGCSKCQFYIHQPCMGILPQKTIHRLLSQTIVLLTVPSFECTTCNRACSGLNYYCSESRCNFCVKCVIWPENEFGQSGELKSIHHWHQLDIGEIDKVDQTRCFMCREYCSGHTYNCSQCEIFFHKQCAELPQELWTSLHPRHPLSLVNKSPSIESRGYEVCYLCLKDFSMNSFGYYNGSYRCKECTFKLDSFCACRLPSVQHQHHVHLLTVVENMYVQKYCRACYALCTGVTLACAECSFYLHLECGPLPCTIKSTFHIHSLTLEDYYAEDNEADKFACHICEEERNPRLPVYCCIEGCLMICDVKCLLPELLPILRGEHGCVVTRTTFPNVACEIVSRKMVLEEKKMIPTSQQGAREGNSESKYGFNFKDLHESFVNSALEKEEEEEEEETLGIEFLEAGYAQNDSSGTKDEDSDRKDQSHETKALSKDDATILGKEVGRLISSNETRYFYSLEALSSFQNHLRCPPLHNLELFFLQKYMGERMIGEYALPMTLHPLYQLLFGKHKIIDDKFKLRYPIKRYLIFVVCNVVYEMRRCKVVDLKKEGILCWLGWIKYVEDEGSFDLSFVVESIKRLWKAHYVIEAKRRVDEKSKKLRQQLDELSQEEDDLAKKLEATRKKIQETKKEEMAHKEYRAAGASKLKKQYKDALEIKWKPSSDCILKYPDYADSSFTK